MIAGTTITELKQSVLNRLEGRFPQLDLCCGFRREEYFGTLRRPLISITVKQIETKRAAMQNYLGMGTLEGGWQECYGETAVVQFAFQLFLPPGTGGEGGEELFLTLCDALLFWEETPFTRFACGEPEFSEQGQCFVQLMTAEVETLVTQVQPVTTITEFRLKAQAKV